MKTVLLAAAAALTLTFVMQPSESQAAAWCGTQMGPGAPGTRDCRFTSLRQCRSEMLAGNRGQCSPNSSYRRRAKRAY